MSCSINSPMSILDEDKYNSERLLALKYIKDRIGSATILNVLAPITPQDEYIFDAARVNDQSSDVSELSDPFAELGGNIILSAENKQKRRLSKVEADVLVMNSFPATHMEIQNEIISEMNLIIPPQLDIKKIMEVNSDEEEDPESAEVMQSVEASLEQCGLKVYREEKKKRDEKQSQQQKQRQKKVKTQDELDIETNSLSGIWRMLDAVSIENDGFPITQPGYNFFDDKQSWTPIEKPWNEKEEIRKKCENWLKNIKQ